jgi:hypothetical protein
LPWFLGVLLIPDGLAVFVWFLQRSSLLDRPELITPGRALSFIAEVGLGPWLILRGFKDVPDAPVLPD